MKTMVIGGFVGFVAAAATGMVGQSSGPIVINLDRPGEAILLTLEGKPAGGMRIDEQGRLGIFGPNRTSTIVTIDNQDHVQIDPEPVHAPKARLTIANDTWLTGVLRVGLADAFGDAPFDPNGAIQLGRKLDKAQPIALLRAFAHGKESFRLGANTEGIGYWSDGPHDSPLMTFHPSAPGEQESGKAFIYAAEVATR